MRTGVILGLLAGLALSPKLWLSSRLYPLTPVWPFLRPLGSPGDYLVYFTMFALLIAAAVAPRRATLAAAIALLVLVALQDQSRWQPWFYQYLLMLLAIAFAGPDRPEAARNTCCLIVAATYIWSGLSKLNPNFANDTFPWMVAPFLKGWLGHHMGYAAALLESVAGAALLTRRFRRAAVFILIAMHGFILLTLGPLGRSFNFVVWPWNVAMIAFLVILFWNSGQPAREIVWGRGFAFQKVVLFVFAVMPVLSFFNLWDDYLSSAMYSGNKTSGTIYMNDDAFDRLPDEIQDYVTDEGPGRGALDLNDWSYGELNVPAYPEARVYKNVARRICGYASDGAGVELVVQGKAALANSNRKFVYHCSDLPKGELQ